MSKLSNQFKSSSIFLQFCVTTKILFHVENKCWGRDVNSFHYKPQNYTILLTNIYTTLLGTTSKSDNIRQTYNSNDWLQITATNPTPVSQENVNDHLGRTWNLKSWKLKLEIHFGCKTLLIEWCQKQFVKNVCDSPLIKLII